jgi:hypothetical protein
LPHHVLSSTTSNIPLTQSLHRAETLPRVNYLPEALLTTHDAEQNSSRSGIWLCREICLAPRADPELQDLRPRLATDLHLSGILCPAMASSTRSLFRTPASLSLPAALQPSRLPARSKPNLYRHQTRHASVRRRSPQERLASLSSPKQPIHQKSKAFAPKTRLAVGLVLISMLVYSMVRPSLC